MKEESINRTDVNTIGEFGLINRITKQFSLKQKSSDLGVGDDAAILDFADVKTVVSTDMLIEGIHFDLMYTPLKHLGYKAVVVNISDIYAMNAIPSQITFSMAFSSKYSIEAIDEIYAGVKQACDFYNVDLVGGDTTSSPKGMAISVTALGYTSEGLVTKRNGAKVGDIICVTGNLGASYLGLQILEREKQLFINQPGIQPDLKEAQYLIERHLKPEARKDAIEYFFKNKFTPTSMIDVSDGLASELFHICTSSKVGAFIEESKVPIHPEAQVMALKFNTDPITCALNGGEDYELLFTIDEKDLEKVKFMPDIYIIGEVVAKEDGVKLHTTGGNIHDIKAQGWNHFE